MTVQEVIVSLEDILKNIGNAGLQMDDGWTVTHISYDLNEGTAHVSNEDDFTMPEKHHRTLCVEDALELCKDARRLMGGDSPVMMGRYEVVSVAFDPGQVCVVLTAFPQPSPIV
jgi:hypothetical protein